MTEHPVRYTQYSKTYLKKKENNTQDGVLFHCVCVCEFKLTFNQSNTYLGASHVHIDITKIGKWTLVSQRTTKQLS